MFEDGNDYVRCLLIDYSKAFDVINHSILLGELSELGLNRSVFFWIADFLSCRTQSTTAFDHITSKLPISRSIVQGSGIGPMLYVLSARKLTTLSHMNSLSKYADDTTLLVPQHSDRSIEDEFAHIQDWSIANKLNINKTKTVEIIFWRTSQIKVKYHVPNIMEVERVDSVKLLGVFLTSNISWSLQINHLVTGITRKFYVLNQIKHMSLGIDGLNSVFRAMVLSRIQYALPVYSGNSLQSDITRIDTALLKARRWGLMNIQTDFDALARSADHTLFNEVLKSSHCLNKLLPPKKNNHP